MGFKIYDVQCTQCHNKREEFVREMKPEFKLYCPYCKLETTHKPLPATPAFQVSGGYDSRMKR